MRPPCWILLVTLVGCATTSSRAPVLVAPAVSDWRLPGAGESQVAMDYLAFDPVPQRLWVPAGNTGRVDVIDVESGALHEVAGFPTAEATWNGKTRRIGPSSAAVGEGVVFVGNRADSSICGISSERLARGACLTLPSMPDGLAYVRATRELWVTTPRAKSILILEAATPDHLTVKATISLPGEPESFAVDESRGVVYTNLEDLDRTLRIDVRTHAVLETWQPGCGGEGPRGLALDAKLDLLFVACHDANVQVLDAGLHGNVVAQVPTGPGLDNIDYVEATHRVLAASSAGQLTIARVDAHGKVEGVETVPTAPGARCVLGDPRGDAFVADSAGGRIIVVRHP